jgi:hypothetical protein
MVVVEVEVSIPLTAAHLPEPVVLVAEVLAV